jgi:hypothetical protein
VLVGVPESRTAVKILFDVGNKVDVGETTQPADGLRSLDDGLLVAFGLLE